MRRPGFTLMETLVAVAILGLVSVGALRLVIVSQRTLEEVRMQRLLLDAVRDLQVIQKAGSLPDRGTSDDVGWEIEEKQEKIPQLGTDIRYRVLTVTKSGRSISLWLP